MLDTRCLVAVPVMLVLLVSASWAGESTREFEIVLDTGGAPLGAYTIVLSYKADRVRVDAVDGGATPAFRGRPLHNAASFTTGTTKLSAFQTQTMAGPAGEVSIARVTVTETRRSNKASRGRSGKPPFQVRVEVAADTGGHALRPRVDVRPIASADE